MGRVNPIERGFWKPLERARAQQAKRRDHFWLTRPWCVLSLTRVACRCHL